MNIDNVTSKPERATFGEVIKMQQALVENDLTNWERGLIEEWLAVACKLPETTDDV